MTVPFCRNHRKASELPPSEMTRAQKYESPYSPDWERVFEMDAHEQRDIKTTHAYARGNRRAHVPYTESQAIMEAPPGAPIPKSHEEGHDQHERIVDAIDRLDSRSRYIFDALALGQGSLRSVGKELSLSKTQIDRIYKAALATLQNELKDMVD